MAHGLHGFIYRELVELEKKGFEIYLYPTLLGDGPYSAHDTWQVYKYNAITLLPKQIKYLFSSPRKYCSLLREAFSTRTLVNFFIANDVSRIMKKDGIERLHCHFGDHKFYVGYYVKRILGLPLSVTIHAYELYNNPKPYFFKRALQSANDIVTISDYNRALLIKRYDVPQDNVKTIRLFTDKGLDKEMKIHGRDKKIILAIGRFVEKKGWETLIKALKELDRDDITLQIIGSGPIDVKSMVNELGLASKVEFLSGISDEDLSDLYQEADIFCLPSETSSYGDKEGIPVVLMEAMGFGKPVISTRHAGIPELVENILINERDHTSLAKAIDDLASDTNLRRELGERNREIIKEKYSPRNIFPLIDVFKGGNK
jgi:glycosyltransferase involved in cell wall biosynthesis